MRQTLNSRLILCKKRPWHKPGGSGSCTRSRQSLGTASRGCLLQKTQTAPLPWWQILPNKVPAAGMSRERVLTPELTPGSLNIGISPKIHCSESNESRPMSFLFSLTIHYSHYFCPEPLKPSCLPPESPRCRRVGGALGRPGAVCVAGLLWLSVEGLCW